MFQLREFVSERLSAAAAEIFGEFEKTIALYQGEVTRSRDEVDHLRRQLDLFHDKAAADQREDNSTVVAEECILNLEQENQGPKTPVKTEESHCGLVLEVPRPSQTNVDLINSDCHYYMINTDLEISETKEEQKEFTIDKELEVVIPLPNIVKSYKDQPDTQSTNESPPQPPGCSAAQNKNSTQDCIKSKRRKSKKTHTLQDGPETTKNECHSHDVLTAHFNSVKTCVWCQAPLKQWDLECKSCSSIAHKSCFRRSSVNTAHDSLLERNDEVQTSDDEMSGSGDDYIPYTDAFSNLDSEQDSVQEEIPFSSLDQKCSSVQLSQPAEIDQSHLFYKDDASLNKTSEMKDQEVIAHDGHKSPSKQSSKDFSQVIHEKNNFCFVCGKPQQKLARHFKVHRNVNEEIAQVLSLKPASNKRKELLEQLRNRGNFIHNSKVLAEGTGSLKVKRRPKGDKARSYQYCLYCKGSFVRQELWRHLKRCPSKKRGS
ncbi:uncharacterized protein ACJ7VT_022035 [Polymixia lowei]